MKAYGEDEITKQLSSVPQWTVRSGRLVREFAFADFVAAMVFVNRIASLAESAGHHPDIDIRYNRVRLGLETHDANGITEKDFLLAQEADLAFTQ
jgi:4a-hydroxytetrahydrobiopterin dehydratase